MSNTPDLSTPAAQRAWQRILADEQAALDAAMAEAQRQQAQAIAARESGQRAAKLQAIEKLKALAPAYADRDEAARVIVPLLVKLISSSRVIAEERFRAFSGVPATGMSGVDVEQVIREICSDAGIPFLHQHIEAQGSTEDERIVLTAIRALLAGGLIGDGWICGRTI